MSADCGCGSPEYPEWTWSQAERNSWLAHILGTLLDVLATAAAQDESDRTYYHYTPQRFVPLILASGTLESDSGWVYLTTDVYSSGNQALSFLALKERPDAGFILSTSDMGPPAPIYLGRVLPKHGQLGGGTEDVKAPPFPIGFPPRVFNLGP